MTRFILASLLALAAAASISWMTATTDASIARGVGMSTVESPVHASAE